MVRTSATCAHVLSARGAAVTMTGTRTVATGTVGDACQLQGRGGVHFELALRAQRSGQLCMASCQWHSRSICWHQAIYRWQRRALLTHNEQLSLAVRYFLKRRQGILLVRADPRGRLVFGAAGVAAACQPDSARARPSAPRPAARAAGAIARGAVSGAAP